MDFIGIKVPQSVSVVECAKALRKLCPISITEIRRRIIEGDYIYRGSFIGADEVDLAIGVYNALTGVGIEAQCYEHNEAFEDDQLMSFEDLQNWSRTCHEIEEEEY